MSKFKVGDKVIRSPDNPWFVHTGDAVLTVSVVENWYIQVHGHTGWGHEDNFFLAQDQQPDPSAEKITKPSNPKDVIGSTKPPLHHIPCGPLFEIGGALLSGACKYGAHNWRVVGVRSDVYYDAAMRHMMQWWEGEDVDAESGMSHLAHAAACCIILMDANKLGKLSDNRPPKAANPSAAVADQIKAILANYPNPVKPFTQIEETNNA